MKELPIITTPTRHRSRDDSSTSKENDSYNLDRTRSRRFSRKAEMLRKKRLQKSFCDSDCQPSVTSLSSISSTSIRGQIQSMTRRRTLSPVELEYDRQATVPLSIIAKKLHYSDDNINVENSNDYVAPFRDRRNSNFSDVESDIDSFRKESRFTYGKSIVRREEYESSDTEVSMGQSFTIEKAEIQSISDKNICSNKSRQDILHSKRNLSFIDDYDDLPFDEQSKNNDVNEIAIKSDESQELPATVAVMVSDQQNEVNDEYSGMKILYHALTCSSTSLCSCRSEKHCRANKTLFNHMLNCSERCKLPGCEKLKKAWNHYRRCQCEQKFSSCKLCQQFWA